MLNRGAVRTLTITGYRTFRQFSASLGPLTVIIGANGSGKTSLFDFLRFLSFTAGNPLPPEIDPRAAGKTLFHVAIAGKAPLEKIAFTLEVELGQRKPLLYDVEIRGPIGEPRVMSETLRTTEPLFTDEYDPFIFLNFRLGKGVVRDQRQKKFVRPEWTVRPNELALRRALDPTLITISNFQTFLSSWKFYSGFDVSSTSAIRRPTPIEPNPTLAEDGSNLAAVLFWFVTEHREIWAELETHIKSVVPEFLSLNIKSRGGPGMVVGVWTETGGRELTLADLSDGTLRFLCWASLCLSPEGPPVMCIDEPELGLHPRVLPVLASLMRFAASRSQVLAATHSPYLLSQFSLDEVGVMRREEGRAVFRRPADSSALKREVEEVGGPALIQLHISDELEARS